VYQARNDLVQCLYIVLKFEESGTFRLHKSCQDVSGLSGLSPVWFWREHFDTSIFDCLFTYRLIIFKTSFNSTHGILA